ncbi:gamma-glutamylcyclotransferase, partial [Mycobacteroides abscessus]
PLFVYGNLKPGELGHVLISPWVCDSRPAAVAGHLWVRDGVPLADLGSRGYIRGHLLTLSASGYRAVGELEPTAYYQWAKVTCIEPSRLKANTLVAAGGLTPDRGGGDVLYEPWTSAQDPLLTYGLAAVTDTLRNDGRAAFQGEQA